jgi:hypothetical protein
MQNQKQVTDTRVTREPDNALEEFRLSAEEMRQAIADGSAIALSIVVEAAFYENEWWIENRHTKEWIMADAGLTAALDRRREQMHQADASVAARSNRK